MKTTRLLAWGGLVLFMVRPGNVAGGEQDWRTEGLDNVIEKPRPVRLFIDYATIEAASAAERQGDVGEALAILGEAIEREDGDGTLIAARGAVHLQRGDVEAARADFERAIAANSNDPSGFAGLCVLAVMEGAPMRAEDHCTAARNRNIVDPVYGQILMASKIMEVGLGEVEVGTLDALAVANPYVPAIRLLSLEANLRGHKNSMARGDLGLLWQVYELPGDAPPRILDRIAAFKLADLVGAAIPCYLASAEVRVDRMEGKTPPARRVQQALACQPDDALLRAERVDHLNRAAMTARDAGHDAQAIGLLQEAVKIAPDDPILLYNLADTAFEGGDPSTAEAALRSLLTMTPDDPAVRRDYGICLMALGREDKARPYLEDAGGNP